MAHSPYRDAYASLFRMMKALCDSLCAGSSKLTITTGGVPAGIPDGAGEEPEDQKKKYKSDRIPRATIPKVWSWLLRNGGRFARMGYGV